MKLTEHVRRSLTAQRAPRVPGDRGALLAQLRREVERIQRRPPRVAPPPEMPPLPRALADLPMPEAWDPEGQHFRHDHPPGHRYGGARLERPGAELLPQVARLLARFAEPEPRNTSPLRVEDLLFLDLETTGLSRSAETVAFLIGTGRWPAGEQGFQVNQLFLRDPADEALALDRLQELLDGARVIVTFNGRGFDLPLLRNRALLTRTFIDLDKPHLDLLPLCRRLFRPRLTNCRLTTLERELLGFERRGDVEGSEAPRIYAEWLRTGRPGELPLIIEHNRLDVALMAPLLERVTRHLLDPLQWAEDGEELLGSALLHLGAGEAGLAEACLHRGLELARLPATRRALLSALARHLRRTGRIHDAGARWEQLRREFPDHDTGYIELAKYHEHVTKDLGRALDLVERSPFQHREETQHRLRRLRRRVQRALKGSGKAVEEGERLASALEVRPADPDHRHQ